MHCTPASVTAAASARASASVTPTGFSIQMCLPARAAATPISACRWFGAVMLTARTRGSARASGHSVLARAKPYWAAAARARPGSASATATGTAASGSSG